MFKCLLRANFWLLVYVFPVYSANDPSFRLAYPAQSNYILLSKVVQHHNASGVAKECVRAYKPKANL